MRKAIFKLFLFVNYLFVTALILAHAASEVTPAESGTWLLAFFGFAYPFILVGNVIFMLLWLIKRKWAFFLPFTFIALNFGYVLNYFQFRLAQPTAETGGMKVFSYNVRMFDLYNWTGDKFTWSKAVNYIIGEQPDIAFFQEFYSKYENENAPNNRFVAETKLNYYRTWTSRWLKCEKGLALFSRFPIIRHEFLRMNEQTFALIADVDRGHDTLRLINVHLQSLRFKSEQYNLLDSLSHKNDAQIYSGVWKIGSKLKHGFRYRSAQVDTLASIIKESPYKIILAGDFNDTPSSYAFYTLKRNLKSTFRAAGSGIGATYSRIYFPFRIDHILCDSSFSVSNFVTHDVHFSDHKPISCTLK